MRILYSFINFCILALIVFIVGRKVIVKKFKERREKINRDLDNAYKTEEELSKAENATPTDTKEEPTVQFDGGLDLLRKSYDEKIKNLAKTEDEELNNITHEEMARLRDEAVDNLCERLKKHLAKEPIASKIREREPIIAQKLIDRIALTPGDMCYLMSHKVLYVTLASAHTLSSDIIEKVQKAAEEMINKTEGEISFRVQISPELIGGLRLRIGDSIYDGTVFNRLYHLKRDLKRRSLIGALTAEDVVKDIEEGIELSVPQIDVFQKGTVLSVSDGICWINGVADITYGEVVEFECGERGMILDIEKDKIGCVVFGKYENIETGSRVRRIGRIARVPVGEELLGRIVDPLGNPIDGKGVVPTNKTRPIENEAPSIPCRKSVSVPLHTGLKVVDALVPIGRGQRELIIGDRQTGKSAIITDTIINQKDKGVYCIYVAIGQKESFVTELKNKLEENGALSYTTIVCATASSSASMQYIAPFAGAAMSEYFMYSGKDCLVIYDDLSKHAVAYRELSLLLHRPSGREAYPGDVFYLHSRLLERAACLSEAAGGGSVTAMPVIETLAGDISSYIPTNVISITDGQIFLESELFNEGQRPAVNVGLSVSRVGSKAQTPLLKQVSSNLRMRLAQYRELSNFAQIGSDLDDKTKAALNIGDRIMAALRQKRYAPLPDWQQALLLFAVLEGFADDINISEMEKFEQDLYVYFNEFCPEIKATLMTGNRMSDEFKERLKTELTRFKEGE
ncbi:MAG: F0F1 ATP synthase subunit alpha [Clostridia bacterium]|nr:F0F1 ATP synthase subunit alpha [Clostridia bacterium]